MSALRNVGLLLIPILAGCANVDRAGVAAQAGAPVSAQVAPVTFAYDPNLPRFAVAVEPFAYGASGIFSGEGAASAPMPRGTLDAPVVGGLQGGNLQGNAANRIAPEYHVGSGIAAQLITALSACPNISIVDNAAVVRRPDGSYGCKLQPGETGPFILRGNVTEFNETADLEEIKRGGSLGLAGAVLALVGAAADNRDLAYAGAAIVAANPTYESQRVTRKGALGMDLMLIDGRSARVIRAFNGAGTFTTESATSGLSVFGIGGGNAAFAASALGQASRAAANDAAAKTVEALKSAPRQ